MTDHRIIPADIKDGDRVIWTPKSSSIVTRGKEYRVLDIRGTSIRIFCDDGYMIWASIDAFAKVIPDWPPVEVARHIAAKVNDRIVAARNDALEEAAGVADSYANSREENAPFEDIPEYGERMLVTAKHVRRVARGIRALADKPAADTGQAVAWPEPEYAWYASGGEETFTIGPCDTREEAIEEYYNYYCYVDGSCDGGFLVEAGKRPIKISRFIPDILDEAAERFADSDESDEGDEDVLSMSEDMAKEFRALIVRTIDDWQLRRGFLPKGWVFTDTRVREMIPPREALRQKEAVE